MGPEIGVTAGVVDDTDREGRQTLAGVRRQYSGTLGKIGNCQIVVSVHAVDPSNRIGRPLLAASKATDNEVVHIDDRRKAKLVACL